MSDHRSDVSPVIDHLFRHEAGKLVSVLTRLFGPHNLELAEDIVQDTLIKAMENWKINGIPQNPSGWLFTTARNKTLDVIRRERHHKEFATEVSTLLKSEYTAGETIRQWVNEDDIEDEQLRMMFVCCTPSLPEEAQVAIILKTLCGFSVSEIANAFLTNEENITKRLYRSRQQFRDEKITFALPGRNQILQRLDGVLTAIYLLFNEGYNSTHHDSLIRKDLVEESLRLGKMIADHPLTCQPESLALLALLCFHASRLDGRVDIDGNKLVLRDQDRSLWDQKLLNIGIIYLRRASNGDKISSYHIEAAIAYEHCIAASYDTTDWKAILQLYDLLYKRKPDPLIALNRLIVLAEIEGPSVALEQAEYLPHRDALDSYYLYPASLGEWHSKTGKTEQAKKYFLMAIELTESKIEKQLLEKKINSL
jgi:RNA polymerase sigma factor (sigma-70 family)